MIDLSRYDSKQYDDHNYNCLHFAVELYEQITGYNASFFVSEMMCGREHRKINPSKLKQLQPLDKPASPCLALMHGHELHAGIYLNNQIIHFNETGYMCQAPHIAKSQHGRISYYAVRH